MLYTTHLDQVILLSTIPSNLALDAPVNEETKKVNLFETEKNLTPTQGYSFGFQKIEVPRHQMLYTTHLDQVILLSTIPSNLALDAPVNEETKKVNLLETEKNRTPTLGYSLGFLKN